MDPSTSTSTYLWWTPSTLSPDSTTQDPSPTLWLSPSASYLTSEADSYTWWPSTSSSDSAWSDVVYPTPTPATSSEQFLTRTSSVSSSSPSSSSISLVDSTSQPSVTYISQADASRQTPESTKLNTAQVVAISTGILVLITVIILCLYIWRRNKRPQHQRLYSHPDEKEDENFATRALFGNHATISNHFGSASLGTSLTPSRRILDWSSYHNPRPSLSDSIASSTTPLLQPSPSSSPILERKTSSDVDWDQIQESPTKSKLNNNIIHSDGESSSSSVLPTYSRIFPARPVVVTTSTTTLSSSPPRPLPKPKNPRSLQPQRRLNTIQQRMQKKPPLISGTSPTSPPRSGTSQSPNSVVLSDSSTSPSTPSPHKFTSFATEPSLSSIPEILPPLQPQRRKAERQREPHPNDHHQSISILDPPPLPSSSLINLVSPFLLSKPSALTFTDSSTITQQAKSSSTTTTKKKVAGLRRNQQQPAGARKRNGQSGSLSFSSESFRCAGEPSSSRAVGDDDEDGDFFAGRGNSFGYPPSYSSQPSSTRIMEREMSIKT